MRAISTVLDASLCLLLVTASALTLVGTPLASESDPDAADETAEVLTTTTARVTYSVGDRNRTAHDTLAGLLAAAALTDAETSPGSASATAFRRAVTRRVNRTLSHRVARGVGVRVVAAPTTTDDSAGDLATNIDSTGDFDPAPGSGVVAGDALPPDNDLHAATLTVPSGREGRVRLTVRTWSQ